MKLIDTSSWIEYLCDLNSNAGLRVEDLVLTDEAGWCDLTVVELWNGARGERENACSPSWSGRLHILPSMALSGAGLAIWPPIATPQDLQPRPVTSLLPHAPG